MTPPVIRVRKAYEQVYDQLRDLIIRGELPRGERLPGEIVLARDFGVSRGTVREALRSSRPQPDPDCQGGQRRQFRHAADRR